MFSSMDTLGNATRNQIVTPQAQKKTVIAKNLAFDVRTVKHQLVYPDPTVGDGEDGDMEWLSHSKTKISLELGGGSYFYFFTCQTGRNIFTGIA